MHSFDRVEHFFINFFVKTIDALCLKFINSHNRRRGWGITRNISNLVSGNSALRFTAMDNSRVRPVSRPETNFGLLKSSK